MKEEIHDRLVEARKAAGFEARADAAASLGVVYSTYAAHENGTTGFKIDDAIRYSRKFKVSLDWLLTGKGKGPSPKNNLAWEIFIEMSDLDEAGLKFVKDSIAFAKTGRRVA